MSDGSATDGSDYVQKKGTLVFKPNEKNQKIKVEIKDDLDWEKDEDFLIKLLSDPKSKNVCLGNHAKTKVVINNDDSKYLFVEIIREGRSDEVWLSRWQELSKFTISAPVILYLTLVTICWI